MKKIYFFKKIWLIAFGVMMSAGAANVMAASCTYDRTGWTAIASKHNNWECWNVPGIILEGGGAWAMCDPHIGNNWLIVDMKTDLQINQIVLQNNSGADWNGRLCEYDLYVSNDGINWGSLVASGSFRNATQSPLVINLPTPQTARYFKIDYTATDWHYQWVISELWVNGEDCGFSGIPNIAPIYIKNDKVGIDIANPNAKLDVKGDMHVSTNVWIGATSRSDSKLFLSQDNATDTGYLYNLYSSLTRNNANSTGDLYGAYFHTINNNSSTTSGDVYGNFIYTRNANPNGTVYGVYSLVAGASNTKKWAGYFDGGDMYVSGNVGIGYTNPTAKLDVNGIIRAHDVRVCLNQGCDYVFEKDYNLMNLNDLSNFVKTNKHLPDVAPAAVMESEGINVSEMSALLLRKVEELTLYVIDMKKENEELRQEIELLKNK